ncbi:MAG: polysaccharide biosynthesis tyrosine autokinase [Actinomycetota bacterium]
MMYQSATTGAPEAARLEDYLRAVQRHKWVVLALTLLGLAGAVLFTSTRTPTYTATTTVALGPSPVGTLDNNRLVAPNLEKEREIIASNSTAEAVITSMGLTTDAGALLENLEVDFRPDSDVLNVSYTSFDAAAAATASSSFATNYVEDREGAAVGFYDAQIAQAQANKEAKEAAVGTILSNLDEARAQQTNLRAQVQSAARDDSLSAVQANINSLQAQFNSETSDIRNLNNQINEWQGILASRSPSASVLRTAETPSTPDGIPSSLLLVAGLLFGAITGFVIAFLLERLDTTARESEDVALALGTTVMGAIPTLGLGHRAGPSSLIMLTSGGAARTTAAREAFRRLRSSVQFLNSSSGVSSLIVTSSSPAEGKSLTSANLAIALAQNGSRCVLVSADLRRPSLEKLFGMEGPRPGLSEYLAAAAELNAEKVPGIDNLWLIRSGNPPNNPGELLNSDRFEQMVKELEREDVEYVVVDTPPVLSTADAVSAARYVDGVIVVVDTERTETSDLLQVRADLERSGSKLLGAVMNRQKFERGGLFRRDKYAYYRADARPN